MLGGMMNDWAVLVVFVSIAAFASLFDNSLCVALILSAALGVASAVGEENARQKRRAARRAFYDQRPRRTA
jgi:hypothetical protein